MAEDLSGLNDGNLANRVVYLLIDSITVARMWGFYLNDPAMAGEVELQNKITAIWIRALIDSLEGEQRYLEMYRSEAQRRKFNNMVLVCDRASEYFQCVRDLLSRFSKEEQIFLFHARNMLVHGWVNAEHADYINIRYFDGKKIAVERLDRKAYWKLKGEFYKNIKSDTGVADLDRPLVQIKERFKADSIYWAVLNTVLSDSFTLMINQGIEMDLGLRSR